MQGRERDEGKERVVINVLGSLGKIQRGHRNLEWIWSYKVSFNEVAISGAPNAPNLIHFVSTPFR